MCTCAPCTVLCSLDNTRIKKCNSKHALGLVILIILPVISILILSSDHFTTYSALRIGIGWYLIYSGQVLRTPIDDEGEVGAQTIGTEKITRVGDVIEVAGVKWK